ncbi:MAG: PIN domain-containing protein [Halofilum sp. (in: g-proteobacteria)]
MNSAGCLIDSNVLLDVLEEDPHWFDWSSQALASAVDRGPLIINPVIYAEVSVGFETIEELEMLLSGPEFVRAPLPWEAAFLAGKCFLDYRRRDGHKRSPLPDFFIGAHAAVEGLTLVTRDASRYRTYFPMLNLVRP